MTSKEFAWRSAAGKLGGSKNKGKPKSLAHRAKIAAALKGRVVSKATRRKLSSRDPYWITKHGHASRKIKSPTWRSWASMIDRCTNPNATRYDRYGARGITIHLTWMSFSQFLKDMGERPTGTTLDRIDNNGNYEPGNCRWATADVQANNRVYSTSCKIGCRCGRHRGKVFQGLAA